MVLLILLALWLFVLTWFLNFRKRISHKNRLVITAILTIFPICFYFAWTNVWRLETYLSHRNWLTYQSKYFVFHYSPEYPFPSEVSNFAAIHDKVFEQNCSYLKVSVEDKIDFYIYEKLDEGFSVPNWNIIYADDDQSIGHEITHIIAYHIAGSRQKIRLLDEGIATWLNHSTITKDHHYAAFEYIKTYGLPSLSELADARVFRHHKPPPYYPAASFLGYLIENYGIDSFRQLWIENARYPELYSNLEELKVAKYLSFIPGERMNFESIVLNVYGVTLKKLDIDWRAWLESRYL